MWQSTGLKCLCLVVLVLTEHFSLSSALAQSSLQLNVNDISFLWPVPKTESEVGKLISADEKLSEGNEIWTESVFRTVLATSQSPETSFNVSGPLAIRLLPEFGQLRTWKIAGIRIDPSAPSCDGSQIAVLGSTPQIRLVLQPVSIANSKAELHDFAAHVVFDLVERDGDPKARIPALPDDKAFRALIGDLQDIKRKLKEVGTNTDGKLGVHPGFQNPSFDLTGAVRSLLKKHLKPERLKHVAFMGVRRPEPWIFFVMHKGPGGQFVMPGKAQMFFNLDPKKVFPEPTKNQNFMGTAGVSTAPLLQGKDLDTNAIASTPGLLRLPKVKEIPDIIANPQMATLLNTDCVSCHTESSMRKTLSIPPAGNPFEFIKPSGYEGLKDDVVATDDWNVRNFGWGKPKVGNFQATAAMRTANEAGDSADFINRKFIAPEKKPVSNALNLVMKAKDDESARKLVELVTRMQSLPPERNPVFTALERLNIVHDARFVFLDKKTLAVITTYDNDFDTYIDLFVDEVGNVFNLILSHVDGWPADKRVQENRELFKKFIHDHDLPSVGMLYSAYPKLRVIDIKKPTPPN